LLFGARPHIKLPSSNTKTKHRYTALVGKCV
jgi:hypothetical protein